MPISRGLVPPALITSTIVMVVCCVGWGALGVFSLPVADELPVALHRYLTILLATLTTCALLVNLFARLVRAMRTQAESVCGYAEGYTDGVSAAPVSPAVRGLVRSPR